MTAPSWFITTLMVLLSACHNPEAVFIENEDEAPAVEVKERPQPKQAYQLTMTIGNAPGPFGMIEG